MTAKIGALSASVVAVIAAGGVFVLVALITITAFLCDLPGRMRRRKALKKSGAKPPIMDEPDDVEKGGASESVTEVNSHHSHISKSDYSTYTLNTRAASPECQCQCEHPRPMPRLPPLAH